MAPGPSSDRRLSPDEREALRQVARESIDNGLRKGAASQPALSEYPSSLVTAGASFVTLTLGGALRGCIGSLEAEDPLVVDVANNAYAAAFRDPRFPPLTQPELERLDIKISVLGTPEPMPWRSESEVLEKVRPGVDGLVLREGARRATFLPSVWESLPEPSDFLGELKRKAGLPRGYWSDTVEVERYTTESF